MPIAAGDINALVVRYSIAGNQCDLWWSTNGATVGHDFGSLGGAGTIASSNGMDLGSYLSEANYFDGQVAYVVGFDEALSDASVDRLMAMLRSYGPQGQTPIAADEVPATAADGSFSPWASTSGSQAASPTGRSWTATGNVTAVPVANGWWGKYRASAGARTVTPASGNCILPDGSSQATATIASGTRAVLHGDGTNVLVDGPAVT